MNRREFLQLGLGSAAFCAAGCRSMLANAKKPIALQLWSINKLMWKEDPAKTFAKIREIGFDGVEFAGYGDRSAKEIRKLLQDAGLRGMGSHLCGDDQFSGDGLKRNLDFMAEAGIESCASAWADYDTAEGWIKFGVLMGKAAETAQKWGIPVSVHNHCHEFTKKYDGVYAWDLIYKEASPLLQQQLDTSQVVNPGLDCVERIQKYPGRNFCIHMKEHVPSTWGFFGVPPDDGGALVPWDDVIAAVEADPSFRWYVIECERKPDSYIPAQKNFEFLKARI